MTFDTVINGALSLIHQYPYPAAILGVVLLVIAYKNPKGSFRFGLLLLVLVVFFYGVGLLRDTVSTGSQNADQMINKTRKQIE